MAIFRRARGPCDCGKELSVRVADTRAKTTTVTCRACGAEVRLQVDSAWWVSVQASGKPVVRRVGPDRKFAVDVEASMRSRALAGRLLDSREVECKTTLQQALDGYKASIEPMLKPAVYRERIGCLRRVIERIGAHRLLDEVDAVAVEAYRTERLKTAKLSTTTMELARLGGLLTWAVKAGLLASRPRIECPAVPGGRVRFLERDEFQRLVNAARELPHGEVLADYLVLMVYTGLRRTEGCELRWEWLDLTRRTLTLPAEYSKNKTARVVPLALAVVEVLERRRTAATSPRVFADANGRPLQPWSVNKWFLAAREAAKLGPDVVIHTLRHSAASHMVMGGTDLMTVARILGHRSLRQTEKYSHLSPGHLLDAVDRIGMTSTPAKTLPPTPAHISQAETSEEVTESTYQGVTKGSNVIQFLRKTGS